MYMEVRSCLYAICTLGILAQIIMVYIHKFAHKVSSLLVVVLKYLHGRH